MWHTDIRSATSCPSRASGIAFRFCCMTLRFCPTWLQATRKMCAVLQNVPFFRPAHLGKGDAALSRCIPLARGASVRYSRAMHRLAVASPVRGAFSSPNAPMTKGEFYLPLDTHRPTLCIGCAQPHRAWMPMAASIIIFQSLIQLFTGTFMART